MEAQIKVIETETKNIIEYIFNKRNIPLLFYCIFYSSWLAQPCQRGNKKLQFVLIIDEVTFVFITTDCS